MKYAVISTMLPGGLLTVNTNQIIANWVSNSIPDTYVRVLTLKNCQDYATITPQWVSENCVILEEWKNVPIPITNPSSDFLNIQQIAEKRNALFEYLNSWSAWINGRTNRFFISEFPALAKQAVLDSTPSTNTWSNWIIDYATMHDLSPIESYRELKLLSDSELSFRFRIGALIEKWVNKISNTSLEELHDSNFECKILELMKTEFCLVRNI